MPTEPEKIILPAFQIAEMYKNYLVDLPDNRAEIKPLQEAKVEVKAVAPPETIVIDFAGENRKFINIIVNQPKDKYLPKTDLDFLLNILKACQLTTNDIAIVNIASQKAAFTELQKQLAPKFILFFGAEAAAIELPFSIPQLQVTTEAGITFISAPKLSEMNSTSQQAKVLKSKLWLTLKEAFGV